MEEWKGEELEQHKKALREMLALSNHKVYTVVHTVARSGMSRTMTAIIADKQGNVVCLNWYFEGLGIAKRTKDGELRVHGCGMDMGFAIVNNLSTTLYGYTHEGGYKLKHYWV
jgi:hypothetical protein